MKKSYKIKTSIEYAPILKDNLDNLRVEIKESGHDPSVPDVCYKVELSKYDLLYLRLTTKVDAFIGECKSDRKVPTNLVKEIN